MRKKRSIRVGEKEFSIPDDAEDLVSKADVVMIEGDNQQHKSLRVNFAKYLRFCVSQKTRKTSAMNGLFVKARNDARQSALVRAAHQRS